MIYAYHRESKLFGIFGFKILSRSVSTLPRTECSLMQVARHEVSISKTNPKKNKP